MKYLKTYQLFESKTGLTQEQEKFLNMYTGNLCTYNPATGLVDVEGDFDCSDKGLKDFKGVKFGKVSGSFICDNNKLTSLEGAPQKVRGNFNCWNNSLTSLKGAPQEVGGNFFCDLNNLTSLKGSPQEVGWSFNCEDNKLTSLEGAPQKVGGYFDCRRNNLTSLAGAPQEVGEDFDCRDNNLTSLEGAPQKVGEGFDCSHNQLTSLEGSPKEVGGYFDCRRNNLTSLAGAPQVVGGYFSCGTFKLERGEWNFKGWFKVLNKVLKEGRPEAQKLISTILSAEALNKEIAKDPAGMAMKLKGVWNDETFKEIKSKLVWPKGYGDSADLVGDLDDVGF